MSAPESEQLARRLGNAVIVARFLAQELMRERHPRAHVATQLVRALTDLPACGCDRCGGPMPAPGRTGRPRRFCVGCSPQRLKTPEKARLGE